MSTETPAGVESTGTTDAQTARVERRALRAGVFGVDAVGCKHRYSRRRDTVYVTRDGALEHVEELNGRDPADWIDYVRFKRGWVDQWFHEELGPVAALQRLSNAVDDATEGV
jgi:hypothetical protein